MAYMELRLDIDPNMILIIKAISKAITFICHDMHVYKFVQFTWGIGRTEAIP